MSTRLERHFATPEEYLAAERASETRSEYFAGEILAMTGASRVHNLIVLNIGAELRAQLRGWPCEAYVEGMRVNVTAAGLYTYPDVVVVCGEPEFEDEQVDTLLNPTLIVEVLSPSTERYDRGRKLEYYRKIPSLAEYVLVSQDARRIEWYTRQESGLWSYRDTEEGQLSVDLTSVDCTLPLDEVYDRVSFVAE